MKILFVFLKTEIFQHKSGTTADYFNLSLSLYLELQGFR